MVGIEDLGFKVSVSRFSAIHERIGFLETSSPEVVRISASV